jgi:hypothetical protein
MNAGLSERLGRLEIANGIIRGDRAGELATNGNEWADLPAAAVAPARGSAPGPLSSVALPWLLLCLERFYVFEESILLDSSAFARLDGTLRGAQDAASGPSCG